MVRSTLFSRLHGGFLAIMSLLDVSRIVGHRDTDMRLGCLRTGGRATREEVRPSQLGRRLYIADAKYLILRPVQSRGNAYGNGLYSWLKIREFS